MGTYPRKEGMKIGSEPYEKISVQSCSVYERTHKRTSATPRHQWWLVETSYRGDQHRVFLPYQPGATMNAGKISV